MPLYAPEPPERRQLACCLVCGWDMYEDEADAGTLLYIHRPGTLQQVDTIHEGCLIAYGNTYRGMHDHERPDWQDDEGDIDWQGFYLDRLEPEPVTTPLCAQERWGIRDRQASRVVVVADGGTRPALDKEGGNVNGNMIP